MTSVRDTIEKAEKLKNERKFEEALFIMIELFEKEPLSEDVKKALIDVLMEFIRDVHINAGFSSNCNIAEY